VTWTNEGAVFGAVGHLPPNSVLFAPKTVYNAAFGVWVMFYNYIVGSFSNSFYGVATSRAPEGPFTVVNHNLQLQFSDNGDEGLFVDDRGGAKEPQRSTRACNANTQLNDMCIYVYYRCRARTHMTTGSNQQQRTHSATRLNPYISRNVNASSIGGTMNSK
jgi:hypothetical protein